VDTAALSFLQLSLRAEEKEVARLQHDTCEASSQLALNQGSPSGPPSSGVGDKVADSAKNEEKKQRQAAKKRRQAERR